MATGKMFVLLKPAEFARARDLSERRRDEGDAKILPELATHLRLCAKANGGKFDERRALNGEETELRVMRDSGSRAKP